MLCVGDILWPSLPWLQNCAHASTCKCGLWEVFKGCHWFYTNAPHHKGSGSVPP
jgi:hypothetical protein